MGQIEAFYSEYHDDIFDKRFNSPFPLRQYVHRQIYYTTLKHIRPGERVLDVGCGEGVLSILMAQKGAKVVGVDISRPNIEAANSSAKKYCLNDSLCFKVADAMDLPFENNSFDTVISNHVLEHLPDIEKGLCEIRRVMDKQAIISMPTCLNPCSWLLLGGSTYWKISGRTIFSIPFGLLRTILALVTGSEGVNEGYAGRKDLIHVHRFPWAMKQLLMQAGFAIEVFEGDTLALPCIPNYSKRMLNIVKWIDRRLQGSYFSPYLSFGCTAVVKK